MSDSNEVHDSGTAQVLASQFKKLGGYELVTVEGDDKPAAMFAVVPDGKKLISIMPFLNELRGKPERRVGTAKVRDAVSFISYANRFKGPNSVVFASPDRSTDEKHVPSPKILAVLDYHVAGGDNTAAAYGQHRVQYDCELSEEWQAWLDQDGEAMEQGAFAAFIEERIADVVVSDGQDAVLKAFADLVEGRFATPSQLHKLSRGLQVNVGLAIKNAVTLESGEVSIQYDEVHQDGSGQAIKIANLFVIQIPVFYGGPLYRIPVRLRYRAVQGRGLTWFYQLYRPDKSFDHAFGEIQTKITGDTLLPVFVGTPEN
jgi:hypothetical protein